MLKNLYTLSKKYKEKKVVVYGVNRTSVNLFAGLVLNHQIDIYAFWEPSGRFKGEYFANKQIIDTDQLQYLENFVVIIPDASRKQEILQSVGREMEIFYKDEVLDLNEELRNKQIYIYGIGHQGAIIYDLLRNEGIEVKGVCVTVPDKVEIWCGHKVIPVGEIEQGDNCAVVLATDIEKNRNEMLDELDGFNVEKYISYFMCDAAISEGNMFQVLNIALLKNKEIWLCGDRNEYTFFLEHVLNRCQISISQKICSKNIYDLEYEDKSKVSVIIAERNHVNIEHICDALDDIGFGLERWDYAATGLYIRFSTYEKKSDGLLGYIRWADKQYPGYFVYGDAQKAKVRIMILGGSTSTEGLCRTDMWVKFFYERLVEVGYAPVIYNGATGGYGVADEFLHMLRDIEPLKPDYVISFSGVNDTEKRKIANLFNPRAADSKIKRDSSVVSGIESDESPYDFWCRVSKLIKLVAGWHGARTYNFLQPMMVKEQLDLIETGMFDLTEHRENFMNFKVRALAEKDRFYINLISMFEGETERYIDVCHYSTEANRMIAEHIFETVKHDIEETVKNR